MSSIKSSQDFFPVCRTGMRMRLDKFLCEAGAGSRSEVKQLLKKGVVTVNGMVEKAADKKVEETDRISLRGRELSYAKFRYYLLHKPAGLITATEDKYAPTVMGLLQGIDTRGLFPVGRLDKDTEGLLLLTNDGALAHRLLSPESMSIKDIWSGQGSRCPKKLSGSFLRASILAMRRRHCRQK